MKMSLKLLNVNLNSCRLHKVADNGFGLVAVQPKLNFETLT